MAPSSPAVSVSKSRFKARALEYLREVERTGHEVVITDRGRPVAKVVPFKPRSVDSLMADLRGSVRKFARPTEPVDVDWEAGR